VTNFGWWAQLAGPNYFLCQLCFTANPITDAWADEDGIRWDICIHCHAEEERPPD
jgi:hypothetical protein